MENIVNTKQHLTKKGIPVTGKPVGAFYHLSPT